MQILLSNPDVAVQALRTRLQTALQEDSVLWLISGGSNIGATVNIMKALAPNLTERLTILPVDERFGPPGHADSNWQQLLDAGFTGQKARLIPVLKAGRTFASARENYEALARDAFASADVIVAQLGMGSDGHIAGILPHSSAVESHDWVAAYDGPPYQRLTMTFQALSRVTAAYTLAYGASKRPALEKLLEQALPLEEQPAQFLKRIPESYLYNDQLEAKT